MAITSKRKSAIRLTALTPEEKQIILGKDRPNQKEMLNLGASDCRYPIGRLFCGDPVTYGPYCDDHKRICYTHTRTDDGEDQQQG